MAPSSPKVRAPSKASTLPTTQTTSATPKSPPERRSTAPGTRKMPDPIVVPTTIGSGIFLVPGAVLRRSGGDLGVALVVWVVGSVLALLGALTFGELGAMLPDAGGTYVYVREAFGPLPAFLLGWTLFLAINTGSSATLAVAFANYLGELVPLGPATRKLAGLPMIAPVAVVNIRGVRHAAPAPNLGTASKVSAILALAAAGFLWGDDRQPRARGSR